MTCDTLIPLRNVALQPPPQKNHQHLYLSLRLTTCLRTCRYTWPSSTPAHERGVAPQLAFLPVTAWERRTLKENIYFKNIFKLKYDDQKIMSVLELGRFIVTNSIFFV